MYSERDREGGGETPNHLVLSIHMYRSLKFRVVVVKQNQHILQNMVDAPNVQSMNSEPRPSRELQNSICATLTIA